MYQTESPSAETDELKLQFGCILQAYEVFRAANHSLRLQMLRLLNEEVTLPVSAIYSRLQIQQAVCSQHLAVLRKAGLVTAERIEKQVFYALNYEKLGQLSSCAKSLV